MKHTHFLTIHGLSGDVDESLVYVYKITFIPTGEYYIGRSKKLYARLDQHIDCIISECAQDYKMLGMKLPYHRVLARRLKERGLIRSAESLGDVVRLSLSISILAAIEVGVAKRTEEGFIKSSRRDKLLLNNKTPSF